MVRSVRSSNLSLVEYTTSKRNASSAASSRSNPMMPAIKSHQPVRKTKSTVRAREQVSSSEESLSEEGSSEDDDEYKFEEAAPKITANTKKRKSVSIDERLPKRWTANEENEEMENESGNEEAPVTKKRAKAASKRQNQLLARTDKKQAHDTKNKSGIGAHKSHGEIESDNNGREEDSSSNSQQDGNQVHGHSDEDDSEVFEDFDEDDLWQDFGDDSSAMLESLAEDFASPDTVYKLATRICAGIGYAPGNVVAKDLKAACGAIHDLGAQHIDATCESFEQHAATIDAAAAAEPAGPENYTAALNKYSSKLIDMLPETQGLAGLRSACPELVTRLTGHVKAVRAALKSHAQAMAAVQETVEGRKTQMLGQMLGYLRQLAARHAVHMRALRRMHAHIGDAADLVGLAGYQDSSWDEESLMGDAEVRKEIAAAEIALMEELGVEVGEGLGMIVIDEEKTDVEE